MANTDNECKDLLIEDKHTKAMHDGIDTLSAIYDHQKEMQEKTYKMDFENMTIADIMSFWHTNTHSVIDEIHEMTDALGGIKDGDGSGVWKTWKKSHESFKTKKLSDLSDGDRKELFMEWIDILHFVMNYPISIGFKPEDIFNYYFSKADENKNRQANGY